MRSDALTQADPSGDERRRRSTLRAVLTIVVSLAAISVIGWLDYISGPRIGFSLFYLVPVAAAAWHGRRVAAVVVAISAAMAWTIADFASDGTSVGITLWNAFTRLVIYVGGAWLLSELWREREHLRRLATRESELARTDSLSGVLNSRGFLEAAENAISESRRQSRPLALVYLDLDKFKKFNDELGHAAGDVILEEVGRILRTHAREGESCGRIGGDEFSALLWRDADDAKAWAERVVEEIRRIGVPYPEIGFGATAGVAFYAHPPASGEEMLRNADDAMYSGKALRRGAVVLITPESSPERA